MLLGPIKVYGSMGRLKIARAKLIITAILALLLLIVVLQNTQAVETKILFTSFSMPRAVLLFGTAIIGFVLGGLSRGKKESKVERV
jgi:uncharacterized integral membrane protein